MYPSATKRCGIAPSMPLAIGAICTTPADIIGGSSSEAIMLTPQSQRVGCCRIRAACSSARAARPSSRLTTMT